MATTTKQFEIEKLARKRVRIKEFVDSDGTLSYKVQVKKWYGWSSITDEYALIPVSYTYLNYNRAKYAAEEQINKEINKLSHKEAKYHYFPFETDNC